jgi:putative spermidine/putrescine transport system permease protein
MKAPAWMLALPALMLVGAFILLPYLNIVVMSFRVPSNIAPYAPGFTLDNLVRVASDPLYRTVLLNTVRVGTITTIVCLILGFPIAYHLARVQPRWRTLFYAAVLLPLFTGVVIRSFGWIIILANNGLINQGLAALGLPALALMYKETGVTIGLVHVFLPMMVLPILASMEAIDPRLGEAARTLGASKRQVFTRIDWPLAMPGIQSGCILVFVMACSSYVIPTLIGSGSVTTTPILVMQQLVNSFLWPFGAALGLSLAATMFASVGLFLLLTRRAMRGVK